MHTSNLYTSLGEIKPTAFAKIEEKLRVYLIENNPVDDLPALLKRALVVDYDNYYLHAWRRKTVNPYAKYRHYRFHEFGWSVPVNLATAIGDRRHIEHASTRELIEACIGQREKVESILRSGREIVALAKDDIGNYGCKASVLSLSGEAKIMRPVPTFKSVWDPRKHTFLLRVQPDGK